jgi:Fur family transcriptional regulator, ferric uptake regulator
MDHMERQTTQRRTIRMVLEASPHPLAPHEILEAARAIEPSMGLATIYRTVKFLLEAGAISAVEISGGTRFERAGKIPHAHFHCRECDRLYDIGLPQISARLPAPKGFRLEAQEVLLRGVCAECTDDTENLLEASGQKST